MKERLITGKISHYGNVSHRNHLLIAVVPADFRAGEIFRVKVLTVPNCSDCGIDEQRRKLAESQTTK